MKRSLLIFAVACLIPNLTVHPQSKFLKNVAKDVKSEILGSSGGSQKKSTEPEPACACSNAEQLLGLNGLNLMYSEITIDPLDDGSFLVRDRISGQYYIARDGSKQGPFNENDPRIAPYLGENPDENENPLLIKYKKYITRSGDKYSIKFDGKTYGPYAQINTFVIPKSGDKFAAIITENIVNTKDQGDEMEKAMENAKTDQEKMELAMKFAQEMQQRMMSGGGPSATLPKLVTNISGISFDPLTGGTNLNGTMKYDEILAVKYDHATDLTGKKIISLKPQDAAAKMLFVNTSNTKYAWYDYGTLNFSDGTTMSELFGPHLIKSEGKIWLAYLYYSPSKNAIMRCKIAF